MPKEYVQIVVLLHAAFAAVFFFIDRQSPSRFARLLTISWIVEGSRAAILLPGVRAVIGPSEHWFALSEAGCFVANWCLLAGCADLAGVRLPRWLGPVYFCVGIPLVWLNRYWTLDIYEAVTGLAGEGIRWRVTLVNLLAMFVPVAAARIAAMLWLLQIWRKTRLPGALIACLFCVPYAVVALAVPLQHVFDLSMSWFPLVWCMRVLGFSIGLVMLLLNRQHEASAKSEASLAAAQALAQIGSWEVDVTTGRATWSAQMFRLYARDPTEGVMSYDEFLATIHPEDREAFERAEAQALQERRSSEHEFRIVRPGGAVHWIQGRNTRFFNSAGQLVRLVGVEQDVTERKRAESRTALQHAVTRVLAESQPLQPTLRRILEIVARGLGADVAVYWAMERSAQGPVLRAAEVWHAADRRWHEFSQVTQVASYGVGAALPGRVLAERAPVFAATNEEPAAADFARRDAAERAGLKAACGFPIQVRTGAVGVIECCLTEVRPPEPEMRATFAAVGTQIGQFIERQRLEEQYRQSQKMEAVGTLAGGIAHDFNNILTAINGYCELARLEIPDDAPARAHLDAVQQAGRRAAELVRQIMAFSRQKQQSRAPLALAAVVEEALKLLRATIPTTVEIKATADENLPPVLADATSIHQVVVNLGANASHAMRGKPGRLDVGLRAVAVDPGMATAHPGLRPGSYVRLSVRDTGTGMDAATVARIFEPFFTTKAPGEGTGLGLAVVHGIVQSHDAAIFVYSEPGIGTEFHVYFPAYDGGDDLGQVEVTAEVPRGRGERVLYIDDEPPLGQMGKKILERLGYAVEAHHHAPDALAALQANPGAFDLVITDLTMPTMTGLEFAEKVHGLRPSLPVLLTSGYSATLTRERLQAMGIREFLMKPHSADSLGIAVRRALGS